jgi:hypothetical protein
VLELSILSLVSSIATAHSSLESGLELPVSLLLVPTHLLAAQPPRRAQLLAGNTALLLRQANGTVPRQRLIPGFSAIEAPAGVCRCAATGGVFSMQGSIERPSTRVWWTGSPILASPISMTSSSPKYNTLPHLLPSWSLSLSRSSALHFGSPYFHISQEDSDQLACSVP